MELGARSGASAAVQTVFSGYLRSDLPVPSYDSEHLMRKLLRTQTQSEVTAFAMGLKRIFYHALATTAKLHSKTVFEDLT